jgi:aquaporin Z
MLKLERKLAPFVAEFAGSFFLVLTVGLTSIQKQPFAPVAVGFMLVALVSSCGSESGGHFNPAITASVWISGRGGIESPTELWGYVGAQCSGALFAAAMYSILFSDSFVPVPAAGYAWTAAALVEIFYSSALAFVYLSTTTLSRETNKSPFQADFAGLAVGLTFLAAASACGSISGCCLNPAMAVAAFGSDAIVQRGTQLGYLPLYMVCPLLGSGLAAALFRLLYGSIADESCKVGQEAGVTTALQEKSSSAASQRTGYRSAGP